MLILDVKVYILKNDAFSFSTVPYILSNLFYKANSYSSWVNYVIENVSIYYLLTFSILVFIIDTFKHRHHILLFVILYLLVMFNFLKWSLEAWIKFSV